MKQKQQAMLTSAYLLKKNTGIKNRNEDQKAAFFISDYCVVVDAIINTK